MEPFLKRVAEHIRSLEKDHNTRLCVVLPNRRAGLYLKQYLSEGRTKAFWAPEILSVEDFFFSLSGLDKADKLQLLIRFYDIYKKTSGENAEPFRTFMRWADPLLDDFNDLDFYRADTQAVFAYLRETKVLDQWNPEGFEPSLMQTDYLKFYASLHQMHQSFSEAILEDKMAWPGLAARKLGDALQKGEVHLQWDFVLFAGLNAVTPAEQTIIDHLSAIIPSDCLWDADSYYLNDKDQEAGWFLREQKKKAGANFRWESNELVGKAADVKIWGVPGKIGQAKKASSILRSWLRDGQMPDEKTAVVLADESLLLPVLNSIPEEICDINATMGLPLKHSPAFQLFLSWIKILEEAEALLHKEEAGRQNLNYRTRLVSEFLSHPWIGFLSDNPKKGQSAILKWATDLLRKQGQFFVSAEKLADTLSSQLNRQINWALLFPKTYTASGSIIKAALVLLEEFRSIFMEPVADKDIPSFEIESEHLFIINQVWMRLERLHTEFGIPEDINTLRILLERLVGSSRLPLSGEPLKGLQLMGVLETRTLDFDKLILLSVNEGNLPAGGHLNSFIPMDVRLNFGLPTSRERSAVFAYHFLRLLQHPVEIHLLYNTEVGKLGGGEKSRFLHQLQYELAVINPKFRIEEIRQGLMPETPATAPIRVDKSEMVLKRLDEIAAKGLSPTALDSYRKCSLQFYLSYVIKMKDNSEDPEKLGPKEMGDLVHLILQYLFKPYIGRALDIELLRQMRSSLKETAEHSFAELFPGRNPSQGKSLLLLHQASEMVHHYLGKEEQWQKGLPQQIPIIEGIEEMVRIAYPFQFKNGLEKKVFLHGKADRLDRIGDMLRIIDYKTGKVEDADLKLSGMDVLDTKKGAKAFQLLTYDLMFKLSATRAPEQMCIIGFRKLENGPMVLKYDDEEILSETTRDDFRAYLDGLLCSLFDPEIAFTQTEEESHCQYCDFARLCYRKEK